MIRKLWELAMVNIAIDDSGEEYQRRMNALGMKDDDVRSAYEYADWVSYELGKHAKWCAWEGWRKGFRKTPCTVHVLQDGKPTDVGIFAVDTATGVAWRFKKDAYGNYVIDRENECLVEEKIIGSFRVVPGPNPCI